MSEQKSCEQVVRDILEQAIADDLVERNSDRGFIHPKELTAGELVGCANIINNHLLQHSYREDQLRQALLRVTQHGVRGKWFCGSCGYALRCWIEEGMSGSLPEMCVLCKHG